MLLNKETDNIITITSNVTNDIQMSKSRGLLGASVCGDNWQLPFNVSLNDQKSNHPVWVVVLNDINLSVSV